MFPQAFVTQYGSGKSNTYDWQVLWWFCSVVMRQVLRGCVFIRNGILDCSGRVFEFLCVLISAWWWWLEEANARFRFWDKTWSFYFVLKNVILQASGIALALAIAAVVQCGFLICISEVVIECNLKFTARDYHCFPGLEPWFWVVVKCMLNCLAFRDSDWLLEAWSHSSPVDRGCWFFYFCILPLSHSSRLKLWSCDHGFSLLLVGVDDRL